MFYTKSKALDCYYLCHFIEILTKLIPEHRTAFVAVLRPRLIVFN